MSPRAAARLRQLGFDEVYDYGPGKSDWLAAGLPREGSSLAEELAGDVAARDVTTCRITDMPAGVAEHVDASPYDVAVVVDDERVVVGVVRHRDLARARSVEAVMEHAPATVRALEPVEALRERMHASRLDFVLVTDPDGRLLGLCRSAPAADPTAVARG